MMRPEQRRDSVDTGSVDEENNDDVGKSRPGDRWSLGDILCDWMQVKGYAWCEERGALAGSAEESAWLRLLSHVAAILDTHFRRLEQDMLGRGELVRSWVLVREGGPVRAEIPSGMSLLVVDNCLSRWYEDHALVNIFAFNELHALYVLLIDCTQPPSRSHPVSTPFPADYFLDITDVLTFLATDEDSGEWDVSGALTRLAAIDLENYKLVRSYGFMDLNREIERMVVRQ